MLAHGLGILHKTGRDVSIGFFAGPLSAPDEATIVKEGFLNAGGDAPYLVVKLSFPTGAKDVTKLAMCELDYFNYKGGIHQYQDMAPACGVVLLSGDLRAGGVVHGKLKGATKGDGGKGHTWDLEFTTTLRASRGR